MFEQFYRHLARIKVILFLQIGGKRKKIFFMFFYSSRFPAKGLTSKN